MHLHRIQRTVALFWALLVPDVGASGVFFPGRQDRMAAITHIYGNGIPHTSMPDSTGATPQFVLVPADQSFIPAEMFSRYDLIFWVEMKTAKLDLQLMLRRDGAWITPGTRQGGGPATIPPCCILAVELPR